MKKHNKGELENASEPKERMKTYKREGRRTGRNDHNASLENTTQDKEIMKQDEQHENNKTEVKQEIHLGHEGRMKTCIKIRKEE